MAAQMNPNNDYTNRHAYFEGKSHGTVPLDKELQAPENAKKGRISLPRTEPPNLLSTRGQP